MSLPKKADGLRPLISPQRSQREALTAPAGAPGPHGLAAPDPAQRSHKRNQAAVNAANASASVR